jgi:sucrose-6-phosphate hydrolase SacC (GH32 family)
MMHESQWSGAMERSDLCTSTRKKKENGKKRYYGTCVFHESRSRDFWDPKIAVSHRKAKSFMLSATAPKYDKLLHN